MKKSDILELMQLTGWSRTKLAAELHLADNTVQKWIAADEVPDGPAVVLMRIWLDELRPQPTTNGKHRRAGAATV